MEWREQATAGLDNVDVDSRIFLFLSLQALVLGQRSLGGVCFSVSWFPVQFGDRN